MSAAPGADAETLDAIVAAARADHAAHDAASAVSVLKAICDACVRPHIKAEVRLAGLSDAAVRQVISRLAPMHISFNLACTHSNDRECQCDDLSRCTEKKIIVWRD